MARSDARHDLKHAAFDAQQPLDGGQILDAGEDDAVYRQDRLALQPVARCFGGVLSDGSFLRARLETALERGNIDLRGGSGGTHARVVFGFDVLEQRPAKVPVASLV